MNAAMKDLIFQLKERKMKRLLVALAFVVLGLQANACDKEVKVKDLDHIAPCSVSTEITVCDPFTCKNTTIVVCIPQGCSVCPVVKNGGKLIRYSFGKHEVEIHINRRSVVIDYDN